MSGGSFCLITSQNIGKSERRHAKCTTWQAHFTDEQDGCRSSHCVWHGGSGLGQGKRHGPTQGQGRFPHLGATWPTLAATCADRRLKSISVGQPRPTQSSPKHTCPASQNRGLDSGPNKSHRRTACSEEVDCNDGARGSHGAMGPAPPPSPPTARLSRCSRAPWNCRVAANQTSNNHMCASWCNVGWLAWCRCSLLRLARNSQRSVDTTGTAKIECPCPDPRPHPTPVPFTPSLTSSPGPTPL